MANANVIRDFFVALGFKTNDAEAGKMQSTLMSTEAKAKLLDKALVGLATAAVYAVAKTAKELDKLYYSSQRIGASASNIQAYGDAISQLGGDAESAVASLESVAQKVRNSPGYENMIQGLGVVTRDQNGQMRDRVEMFKDLSSTLASMPYYQANAYAQSLGVDENTLMAMRDGSFLGNMEKYQKLRKDMGMTDELTASGKDFMVESRELGMAVKGVSEVLLMTAGKTLIPILKIINKTIQGTIHWFAELNPAIKGVLAAGLKFAFLALVLGAFLKSLMMLRAGVTLLWSFLPALKALRLAFLASPIGLVLALAAALALLWDDYKTWKDGGKSLFDWSKWTGGIDKIIGKIKDFLSILDKIKDKVINFIQKVISDPVGAVEEVTTAAKDALVEVAEKAIEVAKDTEIGKTVVEGAKSAASWVSDKINDFIEVDQVKPNSIRSTGTLYYGDSIADGYKTANKGTGSTKVGANPKYIADEISKALRANKDVFKGKDVILSSGYSNNNQDLKNVAKQLEMLKAAGANVQLLGVAKNFKGDNALGSKMNADLDALAKKMGAKFNGGFDASKDNVHPKTYKKSFTQTQDKPSTATALNNAVNKVAVVAKNVDDGVKAVVSSASSHLGSVSAKYEGKIGSANKDVDQNGNPAGWAYGKYQFNSAKGGLSRFMSDNPQIAKQFSGLKPETKAFADKWREIAKLDPKGFEAAQDKSAANIWFKPAEKAYSKAGFDLENRGVQEAVFSSSIQHGGVVRKLLPLIQKQVGKDISKLTAEEQIRAIYRGRTTYHQRGKKRYDSEAKDALKLSNQKAPRVFGNLTGFSLNTDMKNGQFNSLPTGNPYRSQTNNASSMTARSVIVNQSFQTDMTLNGVSSPLDSASAVKRQNENSMVIMARNAKSVLA